MVGQEGAPKPPRRKGAAAQFRAASELRAASVLLDRLRWAKQNGLTFNDRRDFYQIFGWPQSITLADYREKYERGGIAKRLVDCFPSATWRGGLELYEDEDPNTETEFERAWTSINDRLNVWSILQRADTLAGLGTYSVILIGAPGELREELPTGSPDQVIYLTPYLGGSGPSLGTMAETTVAAIEAYDEDIHSPRFGDPLTYTLKRTRGTAAGLDRQVHWSRIVHIAEGCLEDGVHGTPTLQNVFNLLLDLEKVTGGGSESYFQRAKHSLNLNIQKDARFTPEDKTELREKYDEYVHGISNLLPTREVDVKILDSAVANFEGAADAIIKQIAGSKGIPLRILTGAETAAGQEAKDADNWNTQVQDRRTGYAEPSIVRRLVDRLVQYAYLPTPKQYAVEWAVEEDMSEVEKAEYAVKLALVNKTHGKVVFTDDEIREMSFKREPLTDEQKQRMADDKEAVAPVPVAPVINQPAVFPRAAEAWLATPEAKVNMAAMERAIEDGDLLKVGEILGVGL